MRRRPPRSTEEVVSTVVRRDLTLSLAIVLAAGACAREKAIAVPSVASSPASASTSGTPTAPGAVAGPSPLELLPLPPDTAAGQLKEYRLTMPLVQRWGKAQAAVNALTKEHPDLLKNLRQENAPKTLDQLIALIGNQPEMKRVLQANGMSAHDYVLTIIAIQQAMQGVQQVMAGKPLPTDLPPAIMANITFVQHNAAAVKRMIESTGR
jgi:hypothetical protein